MTASLRGIFDEDAELYDRARPSYPPALVRALAAHVGLGPDSRVLEFGPGTGQLTVPLAELGCRITAVELGPSMAAVARRNLRAFPHAHVEVADFEQWPLPREPFDLMVAATSFHWLDPETRLTKAADALRPDGTLGLVITHHTAGGSRDFFVEVQDCYERWDPATPPGLRQSTDAETATDTRELEALGRVESLRFAQEITYTTQGYIDVLLTYSNHRALEPSARQGLLSSIRELIDTRHGGSVTKRYLHELILVRRSGGH
ncbi:class I SAM-dependent methyltransferase [Streptomyces sp. NBC_00878]|uniref:class I SAM-dependent methyltransferase n=1 Tax=Streptomyces sp. NBC_00878 TaxID=2975854 RepID=UPI00225641A9|nr:class I SAM-dependent methyltransferase [Streptomyces sp. NBC_00878]MCX4911251.1 class I SAM-dependent methyltransferase [Streptomyces sp. NBC_00878]